MQSTHKNNIKDFARKGIINGINICKEAVCGTIGGAGRNVIIRQQDYPYYISTKDAFSIIQSIKCEDPLERQAVDMMRDATDSMNKIAKDGRTAMCLITDAILQETEKQGADPIQVEKEINELLPTIEAEIDKQTKQITVEEVENVARTASNSEHIGKLIGDIYKKQGRECIINHIENSGTTESYVIYHDGVRFKDTCLVSESFVHDEEAIKDKRAEKRAVYEKPLILVTKRKITKESEIDPILQVAKQKERDLVIFTDDMDSKIVTLLVDLHKSKKMNICLIRPPIVWKDYIFEDFAKCVGATIVEDATGITYKNLGLSHLGTCDKIVVDEECILTGTQDLTEHITRLKQRGDDDSLRRVAWLNTKTATIRLGATNEGELSNLRLACQDAVYSSQAALQYGIVAGGGIALFVVAGGLQNDVLKKALISPFMQIINNANMKNGSFTGDFGYNTKTGKWGVNMFREGIVDSSLVVKNSVRNAIKIASIVLRTDKLIDIPKKSMEEMQLEILSKQRNPF